ncbi:MAG: hypothetical protein HY537_16635 [Deltaproteobacteria bacterium]|nr:hypothetical protein [Deltaproteobacteria bacterium]
MSNQLGALEARFFSWTQNRSVVTVKTGDLVKILRLTPRQEASLLSRMARKRLIVALKRGLYLIPKTLPAGGVFSPSAYIVIDALMKDVRATGYQISGLTAFNSYGLDTQIPNQLDIYNDKLSGMRTIAGQKYRFIKVLPARLGFTQNYQVREREGELTIEFSSLPRAVFDAIYDFEKYGTIPKAYGWLKERVQDRVFIKEFLVVLLKLANVSTLKRVGYVLEKARCKKSVLDAIQRKIPKKLAFISLDPTKKARGKINSKWGVIINE